LVWLKKSSNAMQWYQHNSRGRPKYAYEQKYKQTSNPCMSFALVVGLFFHASAGADTTMDYLRELKSNVGGGPHVTFPAARGVSETAEKMDLKLTARSTPRTGVRRKVT
jgi:hypothetical protein